MRAATSSGTGSGARGAAPRSAVSKFGPAGALYAFTTENQHYVTEEICSGRSVLSVCGSGDHLINAALTGARSVTLFDVNPRALWFSELKLAAIRTMSLAEFSKFFLREDGAGRMNRRALEHGAYRILRSGLSAPAASFFDHCYEQTGRVGWRLRNSSYFDLRFDRNGLKIAQNPYLRSEPAYREARKRVSVIPVRWWRTCVTEVSQLAGPPLETAILSNIADYAAALFPGRSDPLVAFAESAVVPLLRALGPEPVVVAAYVYAAYPAAPNAAAGRSAVDDPVKRRDVFRRMEGEMREVRVRGVIPGADDMVVVVGRNRRLLGGNEGLRSRRMGEKKCIRKN